MMALSSASETAARTSEPSKPGPSASMIFWEYSGTSPTFGEKKKLGTDVTP